MVGTGDVVGGNGLGVLVSVGAMAVNVSVGAIAVRVGVELTGTEGGAQYPTRVNRRAARRNLPSGPI